MQVKENSFLVTGGASGLGESVARAIVSQGGNVVIADLNESAGQSLVAELGDSARFVRCDITNGDEVQSAVEMAESAFGGLQGSINCAGIVVVQKLLNRDNNPADLEAFSRGVNINLVGSFNVARLVAASIAKRITNDSSADNHVEKNADQGIIINTASIAAFDGQVGQASYSSSKAGVVGLTLPPASSCSRALSGVPYPKRLGAPNEFAKLVTHIIDNAYLNGEVIRLDGAIRMV
tara:strand:- start:864 stop:1571 length:708 start_codon:yes stop_codon:yes gene_type:complete